MISFISNGIRGYSAAGKAVAALLLFVTLCLQASACRCVDAFADLAPSAAQACGQETGCCDDAADACDEGKGGCCEGDAPSCPPTCHCEGCPRASFTEAPTRFEGCPAPVFRFFHSDGVVNYRSVDLPVPTGPPRSA